MNDELDPIDETLARGLGALAPAEFELDADRALGSLRPALRRARTRRRVAAATTTLGVFVAVAAGAAVLVHHPGSKLDVHPSSHGTASTPAKTPRSTTTHPSTPTTAKSVITPTTTRDHPRATTTTNANPGPGPRPTTTAPRPTPTTTPGDHHGATTTVPAPATHTYVATGGRITVRFASGRLTLLSKVAAAGYTSDVRTSSPTEIEVRFSNGSHTSRIRLRIKDGALEPEISEN